MSALNAHRIVTLNCGMGRDSIAMVCLLAEGKLQHNGRLLEPRDIDAVVHAHTGNEWNHTYRLFRRIANLCDEIGVPFVELAKGDARYHLRPALMDDFQSRATVASLARGDCTENHKILPIRRYIVERARARFGVKDGRAWTSAMKKGASLIQSEDGTVRPGRYIGGSDRGIGRVEDPHLSLIGFAADETARLVESTRSPQYVSEAYPLVEMGINKADEQAILDRHGFGDVRKSGCYCCPYQPPGWYWALFVTQPFTYAKVVAYEAHAMERNPRMNVTGRKVGGRGGRLLRIPEVVSRWRAANPTATVADVLAKKYTRCLGEARDAIKTDNAQLVELRTKEMT